MPHVSAIDLRRSAPFASRTRAAFTVIELLVVISIIAVLVALLLPALSHARRTARDVMCKGRMQQTMIMALLYENDFRYVLPPYISQSKTNWWYVGTNGWPMLAVGHYLSTNVVGRPDDWGLGPRSTWTWVNGEARKQSALLCPEKIYYGKHNVRILGNGSLQPPNDVAWDAQSRELRDGDAMNNAFPSLSGVPWTGNWTVPHSYSINLAWRRDPGGPATDPVTYGNHYWPIREFKRPARKAYLMESAAMHGNGAETQWWGQYGLVAWAYWYEFPHGSASNRTANFTSYDGHVGTVPRSMAGLGIGVWHPDLPFSMYDR